MKKEKSELIREAVNKLFETFESGEFPTQIAHNIIRKQEGDEIPSDSWSMGNRALMIAQQTQDARGYKQWQEVGRQVKAGAAAIYIFAPMTKKIRNKDEESGEEIEKVIVYGFRPVPVFRYEDTEGEALAEFDYSPTQLPKFFEVAEKLGVKVEYKPLQGNYYGRYSSQQGKIELCSQDAFVFYHELAHAVCDTYTCEKLDKNAEEIVAEFTACILSELEGNRDYEWLGYRYIKKYSGAGTDKPEQVLKKIMSVMNSVEKVVEVILDLCDEKN